MARITQIQVRRDTSGNWAAQNSVLATGELGFVTDPTGANVGRFKIGDGSTNWNSLPYAVDASKISGTTLSTSVTTATGITSVGTLGSLSVTGTTTSGTFSGNGASLTNLNAANISGNVPILNGGTGATTGLTVLSGSSISTGTINVLYGGTGATTGLTVLNGSNISTGTVPVLYGGTGLGFVDKTLVARGVLATTVNGSTTGGTMTNVFQDSIVSGVGTPRYITIDNSSQYYIEYYITLAKDASASSGFWNTSILYQTSGGTATTPSSIYSVNTSWNSSTIDSTVSTASGGVINVGVNLGTAGTTAGTKFIRGYAYLTTGATSGGRMSLGFGQSQNATGTGPTTSAAWMAVYKLNSTTTTTLSGTWV
jgi:hypothetical protein